MSEKQEKAPATQRSITLLALIGSALLMTLGYVVKTAIEKSKSKDTQT
ncbi:MAG: hypothetical protein HUU50_19690 [Candidatus Brocadiae bacterium]|nr:hypothetical protein [Candidatus Brocadiia bacterium]